jgi:hypothetical protein
MADKGVVDIHGKSYKTVVRRVNEFRENFKPDDGWAIRTWLIYNEGDRVVIQASICDKDDHVVATGFAEEVRGSTKINKTSALENCETSAIGRALAAFGLGGEEYCSADELLSALNQQEQMERKPEPPPQPEPEPEKKPKPDPIKSIKKRLTMLADEVGHEEAISKWVTFLKHCEPAEGALDLNGVVRLPLTKQWEVRKQFVEWFDDFMDIQKRNAEEE